MMPCSSARAARGAVFTAALALASNAVYLPVAGAATPADTLVVAAFIDDIVSLDPAESFEFAGNDLINNVYDTLVELDPANLGELVPGLAESWQVADDGRTYTFTIRDGVTFHSGNPVTADDAAFSLRRAVKLDKTPSFILTQFGFSADNVDEMIKADGNRLTIVTDQPYAPSFFYNCLVAAVASIVDSKTALENEQDGDMGNGWLRTHSAGSGAYKLRAWKPNENYVLDAVPGYWRQEPAMKRIFVRHIPEPATQRLLLERGDVDIARRLTPVDIEGIRDNPDVKVEDVLRGRIMYMAANQKIEPLSNPKVVEAMKYLVDYDGMANTFLKGQYAVHQAFLPQGFLGAIDDKPYTFDLEKGKALLAESGVDNIEATIFVRNNQDRLEMAQSIQNTFGQAGIKINIKTGTGKEILADYRARTHDIYLGAWGPDYPDPHTNADTFAHNADNSDEAKLTGKLAWRNAWAIPEMTKATEAAVIEKDADRRAQMYGDIQREHQQTSPFIEMFQRTEQVAMRNNVEGLSVGGAIHSVFYWPVTK